MAYEPDNGFVQFPNGLRAQVVSNGVLVAKGPVTVKELTIDVTSAGTLDGVTVAQDGTLDVVFAGEQPSKAELPGTYVDCEGLQNIA